MVTRERFAELARELPGITERSGAMPAFLVGGRQFAGPSRHEGAAWLRAPKRLAAEHGRGAAG